MFGIALRRCRVEAEVSEYMVTMTFCDDSDVPFALRATTPPETSDAADADGESGWTPAVARIMGAIAQTLDGFPEALAAVQATIKRLREAPA